MKPISWQIPWQMSFEADLQRTKAIYSQDPSDISSNYSYNMSKNTANYISEEEEKQRSGYIYIHVFHPFKVI